MVIPYAPGVGSDICEITQMIDGGDHLLFVGRVHRLAYGEGDPLIFNAGKYCTARTLSAESATSDRNGAWSGIR